MITRWVKASGIEYTGRWNGRALSLRWEGDCWRLYVRPAEAAVTTVVDGDGLRRLAPRETRVRQTWTTPQGAMQAIDGAQQRIVTALVREWKEAAHAVVH